MPHVTALGTVNDVEPGPDDKVYPSQKLALLVEELAAEGVTPSDALAGVDVPQNAITSPDTRISLNQMIACHLNALRLSHDPSFAYQLGLRCHVPVHGIYGFALLSSTDFRHTIEFSIKYSQLAVPIADVKFRETASSGIWTISPISHPAMTTRLYQYFVELQIGTHMALHRDVMDADFEAQEIRVTFGAPGDPAIYAAMFGCPVLFNQPENQMLFDVSWLNRRPELGNETTFRAVLKTCDELIEDFRLRTGLAGRVRQFLLVHLMRSIRVENVAKHFHMSARTLRRKLQEENTTYSELVDNLRRDLAIKYLHDTVMTVDDIGYALGFSEPTNFRHAFRRWTKTTPSEFRDAVRSA